ncbi:MAG TPA: GNAT family N-acetyltransferase [Methylomirabilota bacterium]
MGRGCWRRWTISVDSPSWPRPGPRPRPSWWPWLVTSPPTTPRRPRVAFVVQDGFQGRGLGVLLLHHLLEAGEARGIRRFRAYVLADNSRMLHLLARFTDIRERSIEAGVADIVFERRRIEP